MEIPKVGKSEAVKILEAGLEKAVKRDLSKQIVTQVCLDFTSVLDALDEIPSKIKIEYLRWSLMKPEPRKTLEKPAHLESIGLGYARQTNGFIEVFGTFENMSRPEMKAALNKIADHYDLDPKQAVCERLRLTEGNAVAYFIYCIKEIRKDNDKRQKFHVLGLDAVPRDPELKKETMKMISEMNTKNFVCKYFIQEKKSVMCSRLG